MNLTQQVQRPRPEDCNTGLTSPNERFMIDRFGIPGELTHDCSEPNSHYASHIVREDVGPFQVTGHRVAVLSLRHVFEDVVLDGHRELLEDLHCAGMLCVRKIRGRDVYSNHSWGMAVDLYYGNDPDAEQMGDGKVQYGLTKLYPYFHKRKWYSGMGYHGREDGMHFEASIELIELWDSLRLL